MQKTFLFNEPGPFWGDGAVGGNFKGPSSFFIGPESDHLQCLSLTDSLTDSLTHSCLVDLIDVTLACEDANLKLVEVVTVANVDDEDHVGNSVLQIWELRFGHKAKLLLMIF